jgi:uncharacterized damage-inducible protein DinB
MENTMSLLSYYKGWSIYQRMLKGVLAPLTEAQLALPVSSDKWTVGLVAQHLIANRVWWLQNWLGEGDPALAVIAHWDPADVESADLSPRTAAELVEGLEQTWAMVAAALEKWTGADLDRVVSPPAAMSEEERALFGDTTLGWIVWHVFEHEIHHGGEISLVLGQQGIPGIYGDF